MTKDTGLMIYCAPDVATKGNRIYQIANDSNVYGEIIRISSYIDYLDMLTRGLSNVLRIAAVYDETVMAVSVVNAVGWIYSNNMAITDVPNREMCDSIRATMVPSGVFVFGRGAGYKRRYNLKWFLTRPLETED